MAITDDSLQRLAPLAPPPFPVPVSGAGDEIIIVGGELTALATATRLARRGFSVRLLDAGLTGATVSNQRWKHSGLIQESAPAAHALWPPVTLVARDLGRGFHGDAQEVLEHRRGEANSSPMPGVPIHTATRSQPGRR